MRRCTFVLTIALVVATTGTVRAGIYCSLDQLPYPVPKTFENLNKALANVRGPLNTVKGQDARHKLYLKHQEDLVAKERTSGLTLDDRIELSGLYLRLNEPKEAIKVLEAAEDKDDFLILTHLATAYQQLNDPLLWERAISYQQRALQVWPAVSLRWNLEQLTWYRRAEQYYLLLLRLCGNKTYSQRHHRGTRWMPCFHDYIWTECLKSAVLPGAAPCRQKTRRRTRWPSSDNCCTGCRSTIASPGCTANCSTSKATRSAPIKPCGKSSRYARRECDRSLPIITSLTSVRRIERSFRKRSGSIAATCSFSPGPTRPSKSGGDELALEAAAVAATETAKDLDQALPVFNSRPPGPPETPQGPTGTWLPDWRTVLVSFGAGMLFMGLLLLQWREWSRRRGLSQPARRQLTG